LENGILIASTLGHKSLFDGKWHNHRRAGYPSEGISFSSSFQISSCLWKLHDRTASRMSYVIS
jgi:hypothetical protein